MLFRSREIEENDLRRVMGTKEGRRFVWRQLSKAGIYRLSFNTEPLQMAFAEGQRNNGLELLAQIENVCPKSYTDMVNEQREMRARNDNRKPASTSSR